jgi:hypothetical protein
MQVLLTGSQTSVVIVKMTISVALIAVMCITGITAFLQQIAKKLSVLVVLKGIGHIVVSVASGMQMGKMMSAVMLIVTA